MPAPSCQRNADIPETDTRIGLTVTADKKARDELAAKAKGKGPMNTGQQGIKKSGKK
jgi:hypothetical protein